MAELKPQAETEFPFDPRVPAHAVHPHEEKMLGDARTVFRTILLLWPARAAMADMTQEQFLRAAYELLAAGLIRVVQLPSKDFRVELTRLGQVYFSKVEERECATRH